MTETLSGVLAEGRRQLAQAGVADAAGDARALVLGLLDLTATDLVLRSDLAVMPERLDEIRQAFVRRAAREPVHRILGHRAFYGLTLYLSADTLEPRPDTEVLVDCVLQTAFDLMREKPHLRLLDMGTGTGAIALALLSQMPMAHAIGSDISAGALETARRNADVNDIADRFATLESRWFDQVEGSFDIIVSNPPYISSGAIAGLEPDVRMYDPMLALDGGPDGLDAYRTIAEGAGQYLETDGIIGLEIGYDQKKEVSKIFAAQGFCLVKSASDYGGNDRALVFKRQNP